MGSVGWGRVWAFYSLQFAVVIDVGGDCAVPKFFCRVSGSHSHSSLGLGVLLKGHLCSCGGWNAEGGQFFWELYF